MALACTEQGPSPVLLAVSPSAAYTSQPTPLSILGDGFRPSVALSAVSGGLGEQGPSFTLLLTLSGSLAEMEAKPLDAPRGLSATMLEATVPAGLKAGLYDLTLTDGREQSASLPGAFTSLGPDQQPPRIVMLTPSTAALEADTPVRFAFAVEDATAPIIFNVDAGTSDGENAGETCTLSPCAVTRRTPSLRDGQASSSFTVTARAQDAAGNTSTASFTFRIVRRPTITQILPAEGGPVDGGTSLVVEGTWLPPEGKILLDGLPLAPAGGEHAPDGQSIRGWTPPHAPGVASLVLRTDAGDLALGGFVYNAAPVIKAVVPATLPLDPARCYVARVFGDNLPAQGDWSLVPAVGEAVGVDLLSTKGNTARLCVGARATGAVGAFDLRVDSPSGGADRLAGALRFVPPGTDGLPGDLALCECP